MDLHITQVPAWVSISFGVFIISVPALLISNAVKVALERANRNDAITVKNSIIYFYVLYFVLVGIGSLIGFFEKNTIPPRIVIATVLPLFLFYLCFVQRKDWFKVAFENIRLEELIYIHLFRFVGVFFFIANSYGAIPSVFANVGGGGDILTAALVIPVVYFLKKKGRFSKTLVWVWNAIGMIDILSVLTTAIVLTRNAMENNEQGVSQFGTFPFSWIPAFAPATIIFLHILTFRKLIETKK